MARGGFIVTARRVFEHQRFAGKSYCEGYAWLWLISEAAWEDGPRLKRGQLSHSVRFMAAKFGWTAPKVQRFLASLKADTMIDTVADTGMTVITICNYDKFQSGKQSIAALSDTPVNTKRKKKKTKEEKKESSTVGLKQPDDLFEEFWEAYPKRIGDNPKHKARLKFLDLTRSGVDPQRMIAGARNSPGHQKRGDDLKYVPMAVTWLNQRRWEDAERSGLAEEAPMSEAERHQLITQLRRRA